MVEIELVHDADSIVRGLHRPAQLPKVKLNVASRTENKGSQRRPPASRWRIPSKSVAFFVRLKVNKGKGGDEVLPVVWQDNYVSLLPGEKREITATYRRGRPGRREAGRSSAGLERGVNRLQNVRSRIAEVEAVNGVTSVNQTSHF